MNKEPDRTFSHLSFHVVLHQLLLLLNLSLADYMLFSTVFKLHYDSYCLYSSP